MKKVFKNLPTKKLGLILINAILVKIKKIQKKQACEKLVFF
jgi:hypothetical protein